MSALPSGMSPNAPETSGSQLPGPHPVLAPLGDPRVLPLDRPVTLAGSGPRCRLNLRSSTVSKVHAIFIRDGATVYVRDLASREGVKVDGETVRECLLTGGEKVAIGRFEFVFEGVASAKLPRRAPAGSVQGIEIESRTFLIGRRNTADLVIDNELVSSAHALLLEYNGKRYVRDLGSRTGVLLNGHRVQWEYLKSGDILTIAGQEIVYAEAEPVRLEPKMRLSTPNSSMLIGPGGTVEQATFLSETLSDQLGGFTNDDSVAGSVEALPGDAPAGAPDAATPNDDSAVLPAPADDAPNPWGGVAGSVAFDDGTESPEDDPAPKAQRTTPASPAEMFSGHPLPIAPETPGVEALVPPKTETAAPVSPVPPTPEPDIKPAPLPYDPLEAYAATAITPPPELTATVTPATVNPIAVTPHAALQDVAPTAPAEDDFESLMLGLDVDAAATPATRTEDDRTFTPPPAVETTEGITLELTFDDLPPPPPAPTPPLASAPPPPAPEPLAPSSPAETVASTVTAEAVAPAVTPTAQPPAEPAESGTQATWTQSAVAIPPMAAPDSPLLAAALKATRPAPTAPADPEPLTSAVPRPATTPIWALTQPTDDDEPQNDKRELGEHFDRMLRGAQPTPLSTDDTGSFASHGARLVTTLLRWLIIAALVAAAAYAGWSLAAPVPQVSVSVRVPPGMTSPALLAAETVRHRAVQLLAEADPAVTPGQLQNQALLQGWADAARIDGDRLTLTVIGDASEAARLRALFRAATEPVASNSLPPEHAADAVREQVAAAEQALAAAEKKLLDARQRLADTDLLPSLAAELRKLEKQRDQLAARLDSLRATEPPSDTAARQTLDAAVTSFQRQLDAARALPSADQRLARFIAAAASVQEQGALLMEEILASRQEQAQRLQSLRRRLDDRMRIRQQQAWENDEQLKQLTASFEATRRKLNDARERNDLTAAQDLAGELDYYDGLIKSRKALIGRDRGDERALAEVQSIIDEQAEATENDRRRLAAGFESMRQTIVRAMPELATLPDTEFRLAADLEARLNELQSARSNLAEAEAAAIARHQDALKRLESELADAESALIEKSQSLEAARQAQPSPSDLQLLEERVARARQSLADARTALEQSTQPATREAPEVRLLTAETAHRPYYAAGAAVLTLLLLSPLLRSRAASIDAE